MQTVYIICFLTALILILLSFLLGFVHIGGVDGGTDGGAHLDDGGAHLDHGGHGDGGQNALNVSPINLNTLLSFVLGFGGIGSLLTYGLHWPGLLALLPALAGGLGLGWVAWRLLTWLYRQSRYLNPSEYRMEGTLGKVTVTIRPGGTGEIVYTQGGSRHACAARSADGSGISRSEEVVVLRYDKGIAYVEPLRKEGSGN